MKIRFSSCLVFVIGLLFAEEPDWSVNQADYSSSASITAIVFLNDSAQTEGNLLGAFVNDTCRGVASPELYNGAWVYFMTVYGDNSSDTVSFKTWALEIDTILVPWETILFESNAVFGSPDSPMVLHSYLDYDFPPILTDIYHQTIEIGTAFEPINLSENMISIDNDPVEWSYIEELENLTVVIADGIATVTILDNTWLGVETVTFVVTEETENGYSDSAEVIFEVLAFDNPPELSLIPDQSIGLLGHFEIINLNSYLDELDGDSLLWGFSFSDNPLENEVPEWQVNASDFELTMTATIKVRSNNIFSDGSENILAAFSEDGDIRGVATGTEYSDYWLYFLTVYSNSNMDTISFKYFDNTLLESLPVAQEIIFSNNISIGQPDDPIIFDAGNIIINIDLNGIVRFNIVDSQWTGSESVLFSVQDIGTLNEYTSIREVQFSVAADYAPIIAGVPDQSIPIGSSFLDVDLSQYVEIFDADNVSFSSQGEVNLSVNINGSIVNVNPIDENWIGSETVVFTVQDNTENAFSTSDTTIYEIRPLDSAPSLIDLENQNIVIGQEFLSINLPDYLVELDGDSIAWKAEIVPNQLVMESPNWEIIPSEYEFSMTVTARVKSQGVIANGNSHTLGALSEDGSIRGISNATQYLDSWIYFLTIYSNQNNVNIDFLFYDTHHSRVLPVLESLEFYSNTQEGSPDEPMDIHSGFTTTTIDQNLLLSFETIESIWQYPEILRLSVQDQGTDSLYLFSQEISLMVENDYPVISIDTVFIDEGSSFDPIYLPDIIYDNSTPFDSLIIAITDENNNNLLNSSDTLILPLTDPNWNGQIDITFEISDRHPYNPLISEYIIPFIVRPVNDVPILDTIVDQEILEDSALEIELSGTDIDEDLFVFFGSVLSGDVQFEIEGSNLTLRPNENWYGTAIVNISIDDQNGGLDSANFSLSVLPVNDAPVSFADTLELMEDSILSFLLRGVDIDNLNEDLVFSLLESPQFGSINLEEDSLLFTPDLNWSGLESLKYLVSDGLLNSDTGLITFRVQSVNDIPIARIADQDMAIQGQIIVLDASNSYDIDIDSLTYTWDLPVGFSDDSISGSFIHARVPTAPIETQYTIVLHVSDGLLISLPDTLTLTVLNIQVNDILPNLEEVQTLVGKNIEISTSLPSFFNVDSIYLKYGRSSSTFNSIEMVTSGTRNTLYSGTIDSTQVGLEGLAYFVYAKNNQGSIIKTDTVDIPITFGPNTVMSSMDVSDLSEGLLNDQWRIISVPSILNDNSTKNIFSKEMGSDPSASQWMIYDWSDPNWIVPMDIVTGKSYWINQIKYSSVDFVLDSGLTTNLTGFDIVLNSGWNLISSPYLFPVNLSLENDNVSEFFYFDGSGWADTTVTTISPWAGYAVFNYSENQQSIKLRPLKESSDVNIAVNQGSHWAANIQVRGEKYSDNKNIFGMTENSKNGFDRNDCPEPPHIGDYYSLYVQSNDHAGRLRKLTQDFREYNDSLQVWDIALESNIVNDVVEILIQVEGDLNSCELWFLNLQNQSTSQLEIGGNSSILINHLTSEKNKEYKLIYGESVDVQNFIELTFASIPNRFLLRSNYPNPFNPITNIPFDLKDAEKVNLSVYDVNGRLVKELTNQLWKAGYHELQWNGKNSSGQTVGTGIYFIKMETNNFIQHNKMVFLK